MGIVLWLLYRILYVLLLIPSIIHIIFNSFRWKGGFKYTNDIFYRSTIADDRSANAFFGPFFNDWGVKKGAHLHGDSRETLSEVLGINQYNGKNALLNRGLAAFINLVDFKNWKNGGHCWQATSPDFKFGKTPKPWLSDIVYAPIFILFISATLYGTYKLVFFLFYLVSKFLFI